MFRTQLGAFYVAAVVALIGGCVNIEMEKCGNSNDPIGTNPPNSARVRTSHYRAELADPSAVAGRLLPYALMSAYAYKVGKGCADPGNKQEQDAERGHAEFEAWIAQTAGLGSVAQWVRILALSINDRAGHQECEDDEGLSYHVWERVSDGRKFVVVAFRGTSGDGDWKYGNLWWFTRLVYPDNQYTRASAHMRSIIAYYDAEATQQGLKPARFVATGHSLGGGLAQHVLYSFPERVEQAIVFDPSSVTAYADVDHASQQKACACEVPVLQSSGVTIEPEARILRVYQTYEILSDLRLFHKIFFEPERHVMEIRFPFEQPDEQIKRHSMTHLAENLYHAAGDKTSYSGGAAWLAAQNDDTCTAALKSAMRSSCSINNATAGTKTCPR